MMLLLEAAQSGDNDTFWQRAGGGKGDGIGGFGNGNGFGAVYVSYDSHGGTGNGFGNGVGYGSGYSSNRQAESGNGGSQFLHT